MAHSRIIFLCGRHPDVQVSWRQVLIESSQSWTFSLKDSSVKKYVALVVAVLGTTISPYLFFWQAVQEVEDSNLRPESNSLKLNAVFAGNSRFKKERDASTAG